MIATITVNPSIDQHITIDHLVKDDAIRAKEIRRDPGGKGINVSRAVKELGGETVSFGVAGGCAGYMLKSLMTERGIPFEAIEVVPETRINVIITDSSDRTQTRISGPGPRMTLAETDQLVNRILRYEPFPAWWVLGGSLPPGVPQDFYARLITVLHQRGAKCVLDADGDALSTGIQSKPYLIKPNEFEMARLVGYELPDDAALLKAAQEITRTGVEIVAVTLGKRGALAVTSKKAFRAITPSVEVRSKVGAGDSFIGGFVLALSQDRCIEEAIVLGMAAATAAVMSEGTRLCQKQDVMRLVSQIGIEQIPLAGELPARTSTPRVRDLVCGMDVDTALVSFSATYQGQKYRFCSLACQHAFEMDPDRFCKVNDGFSRRRGLES